MISAKNNASIPDLCAGAENVAKATLSVSEFCRVHGISRGLFYALVREGRGPRVMKAGRRTLISETAAADWRKGMEAAPQRSDQI